MQLKIKIPRVKRRLFGLLLIAISVSSMRCREGCAPPSIDMAPELLRYIEIYRPGNWWEFRNQNGTIDSVGITYLSDTFAAYSSQLVSRECSAREREISFGLDGNSRKNSNISWNGSGNADAGFSSISFSRNLTTTTGDTAHSGGIRYTPGTRTFTAGNDIVQPIASMQIGNNTFQQVLPIMLRSRERDTARIWVAPNVGIIQYTFQGDTFRLVNWRIQ